MTTGMTTGWKAAAKSRRPHTRQRLKRRPPALRISKKRRTAAKNIASSLRAKGLL